MHTRIPFHTLKKAAAATLAVSFALTPATTLAAELEVAGWIPYWRTEAGTQDALRNLEKFTEVNPFGYTVKSDGSLHDAMGLNNSAWKRLKSEAEDEDVRVIPTVMWSDGATIHATLSSPSARAKHIQSIVREVERNDFDGIDIDYEGKRAETRPYFTAFLAELSAELKKGKDPKWLQCTIEARMPLSARYSGTPPANIEYANDLPKVNEYCDRVRVMTYDQQTADIELNRKHAGDLYAPVSDTKWVEKVVNYMDDDIDREKLMIGVPTYGYIWQAMPKTDGSGYTYIKIEAFNPRYGTDTAKEYDITPVRGPSGELSFSYVPKDGPKALPSQDELARRAPKKTPSAYLAAVGALALAKSKQQQAPLHYLTWSDAGAIEQKVKLAEKLGVAGIAIFKIDGGVDPKMWNVLPEEAAKLTNAPKGSSRPVVTTPVPTTPTTPTTPSTATTYTRDLEFGMEGNDVLALQKHLVSRGYMSATPNGHFGPATKAALTAWQRANGLPGTGFFGPQSRAKIGK